MIMEEGDDGEDEEIEISPDTEGDTNTQNQTQAPTWEEQSQNQTPSNQGTQEVPQKAERPDFSKVCKFYRNGDCKFGAKCRQEHPKFCKKFTKHGLLRHNQNGCDSKCGKLHPNACRTSLRTRECDRESCRFYHIRGTKNTFKPGPEGGWGEREKEKWREESRTGEQSAGRDTERREETKTKDQVFLESQQAMIQLLAKLSQKLDFQMEEMKNLTQQKTQTNQPYRPRTDPPQWRMPHGEVQWASQ
jgi:hypothetical protein